MSNTVAATAATTAEVATKKAKRSPAISWKMMIEVINILRYMDENEDGVLCEKPEGEENSVTTHDIARFFNSHKYDPTKDCTNWEKTTEAGTRPNTSIYQWLTGKRKELADIPSDQISEDTRKYLEETLDAVDTSEAKDTDFDSIVTGIKSLNLFRVPANMIRGGSHVGTNGQPVGKDMVEIGLKPE